MVSKYFNKTMAKILFLLANVATVKILRLSVPELIHIDANEVILDCEYLVPDERYTLQWLFNHNEVPIYQWRPRTEPVVAGILVERLDLTYRVSSLLAAERSGLRIVKVDHDLGGEYTCRIIYDDGGIEVQQSKSMMIFSPERELTMDVRRDLSDKVIHVKCSARGLYPQPELTLEYDNHEIPKQQQRVWRSEGMLYEAESTTELSTLAARAAKRNRITCRLQLPLAGYVVIRETNIFAEKTEEYKQRSSTCSLTTWGNKAQQLIFRLWLGMLLVNLYR